MDRYTHFNIYGDSPCDFSDAYGGTGIEEEKDDGHSGTNLKRPSSVCPANEMMLLWWSGPVCGLLGLVL